MFTDSLQVEECVAGEPGFADVSGMSLPDRPREHCGLFGVYGVENASALIYRGLFALQHRGQEGAGMVVDDGFKIRSSKGNGLVSNVFRPESLDTLPGDSGIGHVRYSTTGSSRIQNVQPLVVECVDGIWAVAHNGNIVNAGSLRSMYQEAGAIFQTGTDSEVLVHLLADPVYRSRPGRVARALAELKGSFSFLLMTSGCVMAARDPHGFRPLCVGKLGGGYVFASETCALRQTGAEYIRDVMPGELVTVDKSGLSSCMFAGSAPDSLAQCVFELVYFARPDSFIFGHNVHDIRLRYGMLLAEEQPADADVVIPIPDSGNFAALGFARRGNIPLDYGFIRNHYIGRTFIMPGVDERCRGVDLKLSLLPGVVKDKRVVVVDDSIIRGTTAKKRVACLREAGAKEVHMRVACPPTAFPCFFGIDFPTKAELIASSNDVESIRRYLGADSLGYLSLDGLLSPFGDKKNDFCTACFNGKYPVDAGAMCGKHALERNMAVD